MYIRLGPEQKKSESGQIHVRTCSGFEGLRFRSLGFEIWGLKLGIEGVEFGACDLEFGFWGVQSPTRLVLGF